MKNIDDGGGFKNLGRFLRFSLFLGSGKGRRIFLEKIKKTIDFVVSLW